MGLGGAALGDAQRGLQASSSAESLLMPAVAACGCMQSVSLGNLGAKFQRSLHCWSRLCRPADSTVSPGGGGADVWGCVGRKFRQADCAVSLDGVDVYAAVWEGP